MCHCLDLQLATMTSSMTNYSNTFQTHHALISEVNGLMSLIQCEHEKKLYLEQMLTTLLLTTVDDEASVTNTDIPKLLAMVKQNINSLVSTIIPYLDIPLGSSIVEPINRQPFLLWETRQNCSQFGSSPQL